MKHQCDLQKDGLERGLKKIDHTILKTNIDSFHKSGTSMEDSNIVVFDRRESKKRKLILHVDLRNTIIVADSVTNIDIEQSINSYLTGVLWGREVEGQWKWVSEEPSLLPPEPNTMTYYKYLERSMVTKPSDRAQLRIVTGDFTKREIGAKFRPYYEKYLPLLKWNKSIGRISSFDSDDSNDSGIEAKRRSSKCSLDSTNNSEGLLTMTVNRDGFKEHYHYIIPSFIKFLKHLCQEEREFVIILRTYGMDAPNVLSSIKRILEGNSHPYFPQSSPTSICSNIGEIRRFRLGDDHKIKLKVDLSILKKHVNRTRLARERIQMSRSITNPTCLLPLSARKLSRQSGCVMKGAQKVQLLRSRVQHGIKSLTKSIFFNECGYCWNKNSKTSRNGVENNRQELHPNSVDDLLTVCGDGNISDIMNNLKEGIYAFVDDFIHWQNNGYSRVSAKPLWIALPRDVELRSLEPGTQTSNQVQEFQRDNLTLFQKHSATDPSLRLNVGHSASKPFHTSETHHHIFFDDNIRVNDEDSIVDVRIFDWEEGRWRSTSQGETELCEDVFLVQANLLESLENEDYFIEKLRKCEMNLDIMIHPRGKCPEWSQSPEQLHI